ncbi:MAG: hypothetical protein HFH92_15685 [Lachnospiraceae bacterium]|uniref:hypothetical protein n=1 Tax=uncultured Acetatifactor sp. TaxID=1671927 RepID=UPI00262C44FD|nr:hypothetical protein [uncultured Acetatifactor sp.]MCI8790501.1 hypothetical protein [Lachnospiraceae bacterium]
MNSYRGEVRKRSQNLLIVEGHHEKNRLFWLIIKCFPEININMDEIWIYGTNIYQLYNDIVKEYGEEWAEENEDIDLPFVISKKQYPDKLRYKEDFTNIVLVFDYERHDTNFSEEKILEMQRCFVDAADMGRLYINYPMIESYQHLCRLPDDDFAERKIPVSLQPGKEYKALVERETILGAQVDFPHRIDDMLEKHFGVSDAEKREKCCNEILEISSVNSMENAIENALQGVVAERVLPTVKYQLADWVTKQGYVHTNLTYWKYIRGVLKQVIFHNISKANRIQYGQYQIPENRYKEYFERLDLTEILKIQNLASKDSIMGFIWVLNTCIYFIAEYNFKLVMD